MNKLKEGDYSMQVCDQCHSKRIKCDREVPQCQQCEAKGVQCTYNRVLKQSKVSYESHISILPIGRVPNKPTRKRRSKKELLETKLKLERSNNSGNTNNSNNSTSNNLRNKEAKLELEYQPIPILNGIEHLINIKEHTSLLSLAINQYFMRVNNLFPLFTTNNFFKMKRSNLLMVMIYISGLNLLKDAESHRLLLIHYKNNAIKLFKYNNLMRLDTLQVILIDKYCQLNLIPKNISNLIWSISYGLGIYNIQSNPIYLERNMCFNAILQLSILYRLPINSNLIKSNSLFLFIDQNSSIHNINSLKDRCLILLSYCWYDIIKTVNQTNNPNKLIENKLYKWLNLYKNIIYTSNKHINTNALLSINFYYNIIQRIFLRFQFITNNFNKPNLNRSIQLPIIKHCDYFIYYELLFQYQLIINIVQYHQHQQRNENILPILKQMYNHILSNHKNLNNSTMYVEFQHRINILTRLLNDLSED